jgi:hypothetical protein
MTLNPHPLYPSAGGYVLKLHRDALVPGAALCGRIEHIVSGAGSDFASGSALLAWLCEHAAARQAAPSSSPIEP